MATLYFNPSIINLPVVGEVFTIEIKARDLTNVTGVFVGFMFDADSLEAVSQDLNPSISTAVSKPASNRVLISDSSLVPSWNGDVIIATATFRVISRVDSSLTFVEAANALTDASGNLDVDYESATPASGSISLPSAPSTPGNPKLTTVDSDTLRASWGAVSGATFYEYRIATSVSGLSSATWVRTSLTSVDIHNLLPSISYYLQVRSGNTGGFSSATSRVSAATRASSGSQPDPMPTPDPTSESSSKIQAYEDFIRTQQHFTPEIILEIGGIPVSHRLVENFGVSTNAPLDSPTLNVFTTAWCTFRLDNTDDAFNTKNSPNFFTEIPDKEYTSDGWQVPVTIKAIFHDTNAPEDSVILFVGFIEDVRELPPSRQLKSSRQVEILVLDGTARLQVASVEDFGFEVSTQIGGEGNASTDAPNYLSVRPAFNLPDNAAPISQGSFSGSIGDSDLNVFPSLPREGRFAKYLNVAVDLNQGVLLMGAEPPDRENTRIDVEFKSAYRYRTPESLVWELLNHLDIYKDYSDEEKAFAKSLLKSPVRELGSAEFSGHGRPQVGSVSPVIRWIESEYTPGTDDMPAEDTFYFGGDGFLLKYQRRDNSTGALDVWTHISTARGTNETILQFKKFGDDFYVKVTGDWKGESSGKLYKVAGGSTWTEIPNAQPDCSQFFGPRTYAGLTDTRGNSEASDNRKGFVVRNGYLYYGFRNNSVTGGLSVQRNGVRRLHISADSRTPETLFAQGTPTDHGIDFVLDANYLYVFVVQDIPDERHFRVYRMGHDGSNRQEIYHEMFTEADNDENPKTASDIVVRGGRIYFVLTYEARRLTQAKAELCSISTTDVGGMRSVHKIYDSAYYAARSLAVYEGFVYFVEGQWTGVFHNGKYPTFEQTGHLRKMDADHNIVDEGPAWRSFEGRDGRGMHTAFTSNLHLHNRGSSGKENSLHVISGYGMPGNPRSDSIGTDYNRTDTGSPENWIWLQYGKELATKISRFPTNGRTVWSLLTELAVTTNYEIGWTPGESEIESLSEEDQEKVKPKGYLFFRPRTDRTSEITLDENVNVGVGNRLDTTLVFNNVWVPYGDGVEIDKDSKSIASKFNRQFPVRTRLLSVHDRGWAKELSKEVLFQRKSLRQKSDVATKFSPFLELGQRVRITSEYHSLDEVPYRVTEIRHKTDRWQTFLELREEIEPEVAISLPEIADEVLRVGVSASQRAFPEAEGPDDVDFTYELTGLPVGLTTSTSRMRAVWRPTDVREYIGTYTARTTETPSRSVSVQFNVVVEAVSADGRDISTDKDEWVGFTLAPTESIVLSDLTNTIRIYNRDGLVRAIGIDDEDWIDIAFHRGSPSSAVYFLEGTPSLKSLGFPFAQGNSLLTSDWTPPGFSFPSDVDEWIAMDMDQTNNKLYFVVKVGDVYQFRVLDIQSVRWIDAEAFDLGLLVDVSSIAVDGDHIYCSVYNSGVILTWDIHLRQWLPGTSIETIPGSGSWVGIDKKDDSFYTLRKYSDRIIAVDAMSVRQIDSDYPL